MSDGLSSNKDSLSVSRDFGVMMSVVFLGTSGWNFYAEYLSIGLMLSALAYALMLVSLKRPQYASRNKDSFWSVKDKNLETLEDFRKIF